MEGAGVVETDEVGSSWYAERGHDGSPLGDIWVKAVKGGAMCSDELETEAVEVCSVVRRKSAGSCSEPVP